MNISDMFGRPVWYVDGVAGDNAHGGTSWADAEETITAAIADASAGDLILVGPGTYDETVTMTGNAGLEIRGAGPGATIIDPASGNGIVMDDDCVVCNLSVTAEEVGANITGIVMDDQCTIRNVNSYGWAKGVDMDGKDDIVIDSCRIYSNDMILDCSSAKRFFIINTILYCDDDATGEDNNIYGLFSDSACYGRVESSSVWIRRTDVASDSDYTHGISVAGYVDFVNTKIYIHSAHVSSDEDLVGVKVNSGVVTWTGGGITVRGDSSNLYCLYNDSGTLMLNNVSYDSTKTTGTITDRVGSIKTKTDSLTYTETGHVDANVQRINDVALTGTGVTGDEWGPA